ncbi:microsomal signal peptidase 25 kDa subunit-domain-containing protein [Mycena alexandri]|uniref:Signal peptidase complex subunit 2 n=1 Tax=Mycena alexandri TaxID=1745969 RepID=A0AAD6T4R5_9AGAR|nr:microsomal signal peptidase 25 kDa subunit-domain-containing protein [Mycena alexandri]
MARKKTNGAQDAQPISTAVEPTSSSSSLTSPPSPDRPPGPLSLAPLPGTRELVKVNNLNLTELKNACDDAVKRYLSRPELFKQIHQHTDVRLALGWLSVFVAGGTGLYGYKIEFEQSKPVVWVGLILYFLLTFTQTLYSYFIEGDIVFVGKRKTFSKRIMTERITLSSRTVPVSFSSTPASLVSAPFSSLTAPASAKPTPPQYALSLTYVRSTSANKSLLAKGKTSAQAPYAQFFDAEGRMDAEAFERWVGELVEEGMGGREKGT